MHIRRLSKYQAAGQVDVMVRYKRIVHKFSHTKPYPTCMTSHVALVPMAAQAIGWASEDILRKFTKNTAMRFKRQ